MQKIPVVKTVAYAYAFTLGNLGAIIGLIWIPMLAVTLIGFFAQSTFIDAQMYFLATKNAASLGPGLMWMMLFVLVALLGNAMMLVPVLQQALGTRQGHVLYHFALGAPEWRMFGAYLAFMGIALAMTLVGALVTGLVMGSAAGNPSAALGLALFDAVGFIVVLVVSVRLVFFIPAVSVLEEKIDLTRGWMLSRGNTLRLIAVFALIFLPMIVLYFGIEAIAFGPQSVVPQVDPGSATAGQNIEQLRVAREHMPLMQALGFLIAPLMIGLNGGAVAAAYRALTSVPPPETAQ